MVMEGFMRPIFFLLQAICVLTFVQQANAAPRPVIVIPGLMGSKLCKGPGNENILWGDSASYTFARIAALRLPYGNRDASVHSCGLIEKVSIVPLLWESDVYSDLLATLRKPNFGYSKEDIIIFDYDWRLSNFENANALRLLIEKRLPDASHQVDIVAHSMGGLIARIYIQTLGGGERVKNLVMMGTPNLGSAKIFERLWDGFEHWPNSWSGGLSEIQKTILSFPSTYQLLPTYQECCGFSETGTAETASYVDILSPDTWSRLTWLPAEIKSGEGLQFLSNSLEEARRLKQLMAEPIFKDPSRFTDVRYIANGFIDTWSRVLFHPTTGFVTGHKVNIGDGTVLVFSATNGVPKQLQISRREHEHVFSGPEPALVLQLALSDKVLTESPADFSEQLIDAKSTAVRIESINLQVEPRTVIAGEPLKIAISLTGADETLQRADLSGLRAEVLRDGSIISVFEFVEAKSVSNGRRLRGELHAPTKAGSYAVRWTLPGIRAYDSIFAVIEP